MTFARINKSYLVELWTFIKYALTGVFNTVLTYLVYVILVYIHMQPSLSLAIGYLIGMISSYAINSRWTFKKTTNPRSYFWRFLIINLLILVLSEVTLHELLHVIHSADIAQLVNVIPMTFIGFLSNRFLVFVPSASSSPLEGSQTGVSIPAKLNGFQKELFIFSLITVVIQHLWLTFTSLVELLLHKERVNWYNLFIGNYRHWDSGWYVEIARNGFITLKQTAFWPLYPLFMRITHDVTQTGYAASGIIVSFIAFVFFLYFLGRIATIEFGPNVARATILLFAFFPTAYYFDAVYTESLFMVFGVAAIDRAMANKFWTAGLLASLATLTRNTGVFLDLILLFEYLRHRDMDLRFWTSVWWKKLNTQVFALTLPAVFLSLYMIYLKNLTGHFLAFLTAEKYWHRQYMPLWDTYYLSWLRMIHASGWFHEYFFTEVSMVTLAIFMAIIGMRYVRRSYRQLSWWLYLIIVLWIASTEPSMNAKDYLVSFPRYILMLFPGFIYLGSAANYVRATPLIVVLFAIGLGFLGNMFFHGVWIA